jgi:hypothetical protein
VRFGVYGNCQVYAFADSLRLFVPGSEIEVFISGGKNGIPEPDEYDILFVQPTFRKNLRDDASARLCGFPLITFTGFHPDCTYLVVEGKTVKSPIGDYTSSLVATCFVAGIAPADVPMWLSDARFAQIGFFDEFNRATDFFHQHTRSIGLDATRLFTSWIGRGEAFMYTINHPAAFVVHDLCRLVLLGAGFDPPDVPPPRDQLKSGNRWPVYEPIARRLNIAEQPFFYYTEQRRAREGKAGLYFDEFVEACYKLYEPLPKAVISKNPAVSRILKAINTA